MNNTRLKLTKVGKRKEKTVGAVSAAGLCGGEDEE